VANFAHTRVILVLWLKVRTIYSNKTNLELPKIGEAKFLLGGSTPPGLSKATALWSGKTNPEYKAPTKKEWFYKCPNT